MLYFFEIAEIQQELTDLVSMEREAFLVHGDDCEDWISDRIQELQSILAAHEKWASQPDY